MFLDRLKIKLIILLVSFFIVPTILNAWTEGLEAAAIAVHNGTATAEQRFFVHEHIKEINRMAEIGDLPNSVYQSSQGDFWDRNYRNLKKAAAEEGLKIHFEKPDHFNPGTDTDAPLTRQRGSKTDITLDKLKKVEQNYKNNMKEDYLDAKLKAPDKLPDTDTDILVDPDATSEFQKCAAHVNDNGGTAYTNPDAVRAEIKIGEGQPVSIKEASAYIDEVEKLAAIKAKGARELRYKAQAFQNYDLEKAKDLLAQAQLKDSQASKYIDRSKKVTQNLRNQYELDAPTKLKKPATSATKKPKGIEKSIQRIDKLGRVSATADDAIIVGNLQKHAAEKASLDFMDTLSDIAKKSPHAAKDAQKAIAKSLNKMSPSAQGRAIEALERKVGKSFTKRVVKNAKALRKTAAKIRAAKPPGVMHYAMLSAGAYFMGKDGVYHALKKVKHDSTVTDFLLDVFAESVYHGSGFGYAWEEAVADMKQDYTKQLASGKPPSLSRDIGVTVVKTGFYMGRDLVVMAIYLPDVLYELITGEKDAQRREDYSKQFLAAVKNKMRNKKMLEDAKKQAKKDGIYPEDIIKYFHCLCSKGCTMMFGGNYNPNFDGIGYGNCKCCGPYNCFKTPMAGNAKDKNGCFNTIAQMNYAKNRAIFDKWNKAAMDDNAACVQKEFQEVQSLIKSGKVIENENHATQAAKITNQIAQLLPPENLKSLRINIIPSLENHASANMRRGDLSASTKILELALTVGVREDLREHNFKQTNRIKSTIQQNKNWEPGWNKVLSKTFPKIRQDINQGKLNAARWELKRMKERMDPNNHHFKRDIPFATENETYLSLLDELSQKTKEYNQMITEAFNKLNQFEKDIDPRGGIKLAQKLLKDWEHPANKEDTLKNGYLARFLAKVYRAEQVAKEGDYYKKRQTFPTAVLRYQESLALQKDAVVQRKLDELIKQISTANRLLQEARKLWKEGKLKQAVTKAAQAQKLAGEDKKVVKTLNAMQKQKKQLDDKLREASRLIKESKLDAAKKVLDSAAMISAKYEKYKEVLKQLADAKKKAEEKKKKIAKLMKDAKILKDAGKLDEAIKILKKGSKQFPKNKEIDKLLKEVQKQQENARKKMAEGQKKWKNGLLDKAISIVKEAAKIDPSNQQIEKVLKGMQSQEKMMDDALKKADGFIGQKKFKQAESVLKKAGYISKKYPPYIMMAEKLKHAVKVPEQPKPGDLAYAKSFAGKWNSTYGVMKLTVQSLRVSGNYTHDKGRIDAILSQDGRTMKGTWAEAPSYKGSRDAGKMYFKLNSDRQKINGLWGYGNAVPTGSWTATRIVDAQPQSPEIVQPGQKPLNEIKPPNKKPAGKIPSGVKGKDHQQDTSANTGTGGTTTGSSGWLGTPIQAAPTGNDKNSGGYWQLVEEKGSIGRECSPQERYNNYYRDTISGFGSHIVITKMIRKKNEVYCKLEAEWQRPAEKLYPGTSIEFPITINRLADTGKYFCDMSVRFDMHDMECGYSGGGGNIGRIKLDRKSPASLHKVVHWKVKEPFLKKEGEKLTIRACYSAAAICGKNQGMKYYYEWVPKGSAVNTLESKLDTTASDEIGGTNKEQMAGKASKVVEENVPGVGEPTPPTPRVVVDKLEINTGRVVTIDDLFQNDKIEAKYLGCYRDKGVVESAKDRDIDGHYNRSSHMTIKTCTALCSKKGFKYAGVQYAYGCFCGNSFGRDGIADNCNMPCTGNKNEICGGAWANSVYELSTKIVSDDEEKEAAVKKEELANRINNIRIAAEKASKEAEEKEKAAAKKAALAQKIENIRNAAKAQEDKNHKAELAAKIQRIREAADKAREEAEAKEREAAGNLTKVQEALVKYSGTIKGSWSGPWSSKGSFVMKISEKGEISGHYWGDDKGDLSGLVSGSGNLNIKSGGGSAGSGKWGGSITVDSDGRLYGKGTWNVDGYKGTWHGK